MKTARGTKYLSLCPISQIGLVAASALFLAWIGITSVWFIAQAVDSRRADVRIETLHEAYAARIAALEDQQRALEEELVRADERADAATSQLAARQRYLVRTANRLQEAEMELTGLRAELARMGEARQAAIAALAALETELVGMTLALADAELREATLKDTTESIGSAIETVIADRDVAERRISVMDHEMQSLKGEMAEMESRQNLLVAELEAAARAGLDGLEKMFDSADVDIERVIGRARAEHSGAGGPFQPIRSSDWSSDDDEDRVAALMNDLERVSLLRFAAQRIPLTRPVQGGRFTSGFGPRRDPFNGRMSMHAGIDIAAATGTPIKATAYGVVTFTGWLSGYGRTVKIRHAFGFETVYAHLHRSHVKVGDRVDRGDHIADMGNTGRSTGTHLHYEVRIDRKPVNPMTYIEAARDVL